MLVLSRKFQETVVLRGVGSLDGEVKITVLGIGGSRVKLGFESAADVPVHRREVWKQISASDEATQAGVDPP